MKHCAGNKSNLLKNWIFLFWREGAPKYPLERNFQGCVCVCVGGGGLEKTFHWGYGHFLELHIRTKDGISEYNCQYKLKYELRSLHFISFLSVLAD